MGADFKRRLLGVCEIDDEDVAGSPRWESEQRFVGVGTEDAQPIRILACLENEQLLRRLCECVNFDYSL